MKIAGREISPRYPPYIVAEISGNHGGSLDRATALIAMAAHCGADAVKFQAFTAGTITLDHHGEDFLIHDGPWKGRWLYDLYLKNETPYPWFPALFKTAREFGITAFASVFDPGSVQMLERLGAPAYKIASFEITDLPLIQYAAKTNKPMIISTGMASSAEIEDAVRYAQSGMRQPIEVIEDGADVPIHGGDYPIALLHCVSGYPTPTARANLGRMKKLMTDYGIMVGISDHTVGIDIPIAAVALGACIVEKHLRTDYCSSDAAFSLTKAQFTKMVESCRAVWAAMQEPPGDVEQSSRPFRRSLYVVKDMEPGEAFSHKNVRSIRPGYGLPPKLINNVLGRRATRAILRGTALAPDMIRP